MSAVPDSAERAYDGAAPPAYGLDPQAARRLTARLTASSGRTVGVVSPVDGRPLADVPQSTADDVEEAFRRARTAQADWARTPLGERSAALLRLHDLILRRQDEILDLVCLESGKARKHAYDEPMHLALTARYYARAGARHLATRRAPGAIPVLTRVDVNRVPKGVVGVISPWNYPFTLSLCDGLAALMAGNAVVAKPDSRTTLSGLLALELLAEAGFPADLVHMVSGTGSDIGPEIIRRADHVCFTGSTATGRVVARQCAERLVGCSLELGGKNPMLVLADADLDRAAESAVRGCFSSAGQLCVSTERIYVDDSVYDAFLDRFLARVASMRLGAGLDWGLDMGTLVSREQLDAVTRHVEDARSKGVRVLIGGRSRPDLAPFYYEPTVLEETTPDVACFAEESFGPVVSVYRVAGDEEAVRRANDGSYGLNASIFSRDTGRARALARQVRCGTVNVNDPFGASFASLAAPMGGMRESGLGRRQGAEGIHRFTETQAVATQRLLRLDPMPGMSDRRFAALMSGGMRLMSRLGRA